MCSSFSDCTEPFKAYNQSGSNFFYWGTKASQGSSLHPKQFFNKKPLEWMLDKINLLREMRLRHCRAKSSLFSTTNHSKSSRLWFISCNAICSCYCSGSKALVWGTRETLVIHIVIHRWAWCAEQDRCQPRDVKTTQERNNHQGFVNFIGLAF